MALYTEFSYQDSWDYNGDLLSVPGVLVLLESKRWRVSLLLS
jgi:hypothetical protein